MDGWQTKTLGSVLLKTETVNPSLLPEHEFDYIDVSSVSNETFTVETTQRLKGKDAPGRARRHVRSGDVIFATIRPTLKRIAIVPQELDGQVCSTGYFVLRPCEEIDHRFLFYGLFTDRFMDAMASLQKGASYPAVTDSEIRSQLLSYPDLNEQRRIVAILDEAFEGIATAKANAEKNLRNARELCEELMQGLFPEDGSIGVNAPSLDSLCELIVDCEHKTAPTQEHGIPSIRTPNIGRGRLLLEGVYLVSEETYKQWSRRAEPQGGDLILAREAPAGNVAVIPEGMKVCLGQRTVLIRPKNNILEPDYLAQLLLRRNSQRRLLAHSRGATVQHINLKDIRAFKISAIPPLAEQQNLVEQVNELLEAEDRLVEIYQRKLTALEELKKSLLHQAFRGKL